MFAQLERFRNRPNLIGSWPFPDARRYCTPRGRTLQQARLEIRCTYSLNALPISRKTLSGSVGDDALGA